jgi:hypothetical protein
MNWQYKCILNIIVALRKVFILSKNENMKHLKKKKKHFINHLPHIKYDKLIKFNSKIIFVSENI